MRGFLLYTSILFSVSAQAQIHQSIFERLTPPLVAAHRGGFFGEIPNNTLERFEKTIQENSADILETDLQTTKDGVLVIHHDDTLDNNTNCGGKIADKTYAELQKCKINGKYNVPSFEDALKTVAGRKVINAEFKTTADIAPAIGLIQKYNAYDWVFFQTKSEPEKYKAARALDAKVALLFKPVSDDLLDWALSLNDPYLVVIEMDKDFAIAERIAKAHEKGKLVLVDTWRYQHLQEIFSASCDEAFKRHIDIGVTNNQKSCMGQKKYYATSRQL